MISSAISNSSRQLQNSRPVYDNKNKNKMKKKKKRKTLTWSPQHFSAALEIESRAWDIGG